MKAILSLLLTFFAHGASAATISVTGSDAGPSQSVAVNVPNQVLGYFETDVTDEPVVINLSIWSYLPTVGVGSLPTITGMTIVDQNNTVVAGPVDSANQLVFFTDQVVFPVCKRTYHLKGRLPAGFTNNQSFAFRTRPSVGWSYTIPTTGMGLGQNTSTPVAMPDQVIVLNTVTAKTAALAIGANLVGSQICVAGSMGKALFHVTLDTTSSSEDVLISSLPLNLSVTDGASPLSLTGCQLWDGTTALNTGSGIVNPSATGIVMFTLDQSLVVPKGVTKELVMVGNISPSATGVYTWSATTNQLTATGATSSQSALVTMTAMNTSTPTVIYGSTGGNVNITSFDPVANGTFIYFTVGGTPGYSFAVFTSSNLVNWTERTVLSIPQNGAIDLGDYLGDFPTVRPKMFYKAQAFWRSRLAVRTDPPGFGPIVTGGATDVTIGNYLFRSSYEDARIDRIPIKLTSGSPSDLIQVTLWDGTTKIGTGIFVGTQTNSVVSLTTPVTFQKAVEKAITVKVDLAQIGIGQSGSSGSRIKVDIDTTRPDVWSVTGISSGTSIIPEGGTSVAGARVFKSFPICETVDYLTSPPPNGLLRFKITAHLAGDVSVAKMSFLLGGSSMSMSGISLFGYEDASYSQPINGFTPSGKIADAADTNTMVFDQQGFSYVDSYALRGRWLEMFLKNANGDTTAVVIPAGQTRYFEVRANQVQGGQNNSFFSIDMLFDAPYAGMKTAYQLWPDGWFIWSPNSMGPTSISADADWTSSSPGTLPTVPGIWRTGNL